MMRLKMLALLLTVLLLPSCQKEQRPEGLPELYPFSVKIIQDDAPLADANVTLITDDSSLLRWPCGGNTDENGIARLNTYGFDGAPAGQFRVTVFKTETEGESPEQAAQMMQEGTVDASKTFDLIDPIYKNQNKTPLVVEVLPTKENPIPEFNIGKSVKTEIKLM